MTSFSDLGLDPKVMQAIDEAGYTTPTPIQAEAIPHALEGRDVLGIAQTGTGKTASFVLPMITMLAKGRARARMPRSLVLAPTRELAAQVAENFESYSKHLKLSMALLIGGTSFKDQDRLIDRGVDVLIATPGRLLDHFERGKLMLTGVQVMVVDEADRMLDMGFIPDIERIFKLTPFTRQTLFFSATMAPEITRITQEFLSNPVRVEVARQATTSETIEQMVCKHKPKRRDSSDKEKREVLRLLIEAEGDKLTNSIVFCNRKRDVDIVAKSLKKHGFDAAPIHGDLDQSVRTRTLDGFREGSLRLLIASDVAARGLDVPSVSHVFNFDVPTHAEDYVHRIGRTGRAGRAGKAITLCWPHEEKYLTAIEELVGNKVPTIESPLARTQEKPAEKPVEKEKPKPVARQKPAERKEPQPRRATENTSRRNNNRNGRVVGMGDHVPAFITRAFSVESVLADMQKREEAQKAKAKIKAEAKELADAKKAEEAKLAKEQAVVEPVETQTDASEPALETSIEEVAPVEVPEAKTETSEPKEPVKKPAPKKRRTRKSAAAPKPKEKIVEEAAPVEVVAEKPAEPVSQAAEPTPAAPAKPAKKPRKRMSAKAVVEAVAKEVEDENKS